VTGHSHIQTSLTSYAKVGRCRLVALVVSQESTRTVTKIGPATLWIGRWIRVFSNMFVTVSSEKPLSYQGPENRRLKRASSLLFACLFHHDDKHTWAVYACGAWKLMLANKSTVSTKLWAGWKSWSTKPTENGTFPKEHEKSQPTKPTKNGRSQ